MRSEETGREVPPPPDPDRLNRTIATELVPQMLLSHRMPAVPPAVVRAAAEVLTDREVDEFVRLVRGKDDRRIDAYVVEVMEQGRTPEDIYLQLLAPAARQLGEQWTADTCDFLEVTVAVGRLQRVLRSLSHLFTLRAAAAEPVGRALLACVSGEQHTLGLFMVAEFFVKDGWTVDVGAPLDTVDVGNRLHEEWFDVVGFSVGCESHLPRLRREVRNIRRASRNPRIITMVGGRVFTDHPELAARIGADAFARDAQEATSVAREMLSA